MQNIAVVFGGKSVEHDISIITGLGVIKNLSVKYNIVPIYINKKGDWFTGENLKQAQSFTGDFKAKSCVILPDKPFLFVKSGLIMRKIKIDCAVLALHGGIYEGGAIAGIFELSNIPTTSADLTSSSVCMDKVLTKLILNSLNISTPKFVWGENIQDIKSEIGKSDLDFPLIVKPARAGSSIGIKIVKAKKDLEQAIQYAQHFDKKVIVEECLQNFRELNISIFKMDKNLKCSAIEEVFCNKLFGFEEKYVSRDIERKVPADLTDEQIEKIEFYAKQVYSALGLNGVVRIDFLMCDGEIYLNEINTIPGSMAFYLWRSKGISFSKLLSLNIENAILQFKQKQEITYEYNSNVLKDLSKIDKIIEK